MQVSELIDKLNEILQQHGDILVLDSDLFNINAKVVISEEIYASVIIEDYELPSKFCQITE
jgi:hypothetical protein